MTTIPLMIDSGAYSAFYQGGEVDIEEYIDFIKRILVGKPDVVYISLDVINNGKATYKNWQRMKRAGLQPIPVYHAVTDEKWLQKYLAQTDHIAIGAVAKMASSQRKVALDRLWSNYLTDKEGWPLYKVHGFAVTGFSLMKRYPWHSLDSTSWLQSAMYGKVLVPHRRAGQWDYSRKPHSVFFSNRSPQIKNRGEHIETVSPLTRQLVLDYIAHLGSSYGVSKFDKEGKEEIVEPGICNDWMLRARMNAWFYTKFLAQLAWPRQFKIEKSAGFFI